MKEILGHLFQKDDRLLCCDLSVIANWLQMDMAEFVKTTGFHVGELTLRVPRCLGAAAYLAFDPLGTATGKLPIKKIHIVGDGGPNESTEYQIEYGADAWTVKPMLES